MNNQIDDHFEWATGCTFTFLGKGKENVEGRSPDSAKGLTDRCQWCWFSWTLVMQCLALLRDVLNTGSSHLLGVTHFISGLLSKLVRTHPFLSDLYWQTELLQVSVLPEILFPLRAGQWTVAMEAVTRKEVAETWMDWLRVPWVPVCFSNGTSWRF